MDEPLCLELQAFEPVNLGTTGAPLCQAQTLVDTLMLFDQAEKSWVQLSSPLRNQ